MLRLTYISVGQYLNTHRRDDEKEISKKQGQNILKIYFEPKKRGRSRLSIINNKLFNENI